MVTSPQKSIKMVLSPFARDRFNYENGATKVLSSFLPFDEHNPEKVVMGFESSVTSTERDVTLTIKSGKVLINGTVVVMDEPFVESFEKVAYDKKLYVMITSNKYEDRMGHGEIVIVDEPSLDEYTYNHVLLTTLTIPVGEDPILEDDKHCRIGTIDKNLAKHLGFSFRENNVFKTRGDLRYRKLVDNEFYINDGFIHKFPSDYEFIETTDSDTVLFGTDEKIVSTGFIYPNGFKQVEPIDYFSLNVDELTKLIDNDFNNIYLGEDGELWQRTFDISTIAIDSTFEDGILIRRNRADNIQILKYSKTLDEAKSETSVVVDTVGGNISGCFLFDSTDPIFDVQFNHVVVKDGTSQFAVGKKAFYITSLMNGVHVPIHVPEFTLITKSMMSDSITEELIEFEDWGLKLWINKNRFTGTYKSILSSVIISDSDVLNITDRKLSPNCVKFDENNVIVSKVTTDTLNSMVDSTFASAFDIGCKTVTV